ncbi:MAG: methyltransferase domain-containing protein [Gammaproteobacteria bacterium]|jgi:trans-aconitate 2-methyltransferase
MAWNPQQYLAFADHRLRPVIDLLARIPAETPERVVDLGCGAGNATNILQQKWPDASITGVDSSPEMMARARGEAPEITWVDGDIATWRPETPPDVLFSNAALHWLGEHDTLFPALARCVKPGGWFAVQMPANFGAPSHTVATAVMQDPRWKPYIDPAVLPPGTHEPAYYYDLLRPLAETLDIWQIEYLQVLKGPDPVAAFTKGSLLPPVLESLPEAERGPFEDEYKARLRVAYPPRSDGATLFPFKRLFIVAQM